MTKEITDQEMKQFRKAIGEAFQSNQKSIPGGYIVGKYFTMGCDEDETNERLSLRMHEDMKQYTFDELVLAIQFLDQIEELLGILKLGMIFFIKEQKLHIKKD